MVTGIPLANGKSLPKAGIFAELQGYEVAHTIHARSKGGNAGNYDGTGYCLMYAGNGTTMKIDGKFYNEPEPIIELKGPDPETFKEKLKFEADRLNDWF